MHLPTRVVFYLVLQLFVIAHAAGYLLIDQL